ncbi:MAG: YeiH family putative sulfate export transporter [Proteobacteria bacterium]|nr:YeiH family putative sulfate export transporter [Pseudomonadota bacterium]
MQDASQTSESASTTDFQDRSTAWSFGQGVWPGLFLTATIAALAFALRALPGVGTFSPMILAIVLGIAFHNIVGTPRRAKEGVTFSLRRILRFAIILLGFQLTAQQIVEVGPIGFAIIVATLIATFVFTSWLGPVMGVDRKLTQLIAAGTSICGASAVIATNTVTKGHDEDVAYAVACVTIFGSISMFIYPLLPAFLHLDTHGFGLWAGASIHEIAQVVAASFQYGQASGEYGTIAKLSRVMLLAPVVITLGLLAARNSLQHHSDGASVKAKAPMPWFVVGFIALVAVNSVIVVPPDVKNIIVPVTTFLLSIALAAMGLETDIMKLKAKGLKPLLLGAISSLFIAGFSLALIKLVA